MNTASTENVRDRKRRDVQQRIAETGLRLFLANGYDATTLDAIAAEAGISRRTFFSYFKSKDDLLIAWQEAGWAGIYEDLLKTSPDVPPLDAVRGVLLAHSSRYTTEEVTPIDQLLRSSDTLVARKQRFYAEQEQVLFSTLCEVWRQPERRTALRMVAVVAIGAMRLGLQAWNDQTGEREPMARFLADAFDSLTSELASQRPSSQRLSS